MATIIDDGNFITAAQHGPPRLSAPIPGVSTDYVIEEDWVVATGQFIPLAIGTAHPTQTGFFLISESPLRPMGAGVMMWTRTWAKVPATHFEFETFTYSFIGLGINEGVGGVQIRNRKPWVVPSRIQFDYFNVPSTGITDPILGGSPYNITTAGDIKKVLDMQYVFQGAFGGATYGGVSLATDQLNPNNVGAGTTTWPTSDDYVNSMMQDAFNNGWNGTKAKVIVFPTSTLAGGPPPTSGHAAGVIDTANSVWLNAGIIPAEPSRLTRWMGNIYQRATRYVLAQ